MRLRFTSLRYHSYVARKKLSQLGGVLQERKPRIAFDETCRPPASEVYAIVVKYVRFGLGTDFLGLLDSLAAASVNAVVVCNDTPSEEMLAELRARAHRILIRPNIGRDFGAYRAASLRLLGEDRQISRVVYLNDSLIYLPGPDLDGLVERLAHGAYDVIGASENHAFGHHVGSFALSLSGQAFRNDKVRAFWQGYQPFDVRPHAIRKGELQLTRVLKGEGYKIDVIYRADHLSARLGQMSFADLLGQLRYMPDPFQSEQQTDTLDNIATLAGLFASDTGGATIDAPQLQGQLPTIPRHLLGNAHDRPDDELVKTKLVDAIMQAVCDGSQIHLGFGLFHRLFGCPLVKKDLLQRNMFTERQMMEILVDRPAGERDDILRELINRGRLTHPTEHERFLMRHDLL